MMPLLLDRPPHPCRSASQLPSHKRTCRLITTQVEFTGLIISYQTSIQVAAPAAIIAIDLQQLYIFLDNL
jgi:hypothetical protein